MTTEQKTKIRSASFTAEIKHHGAELCSFKSLQNNQEFIWQADPKGWARHAPNLFPIVGKLKNDILLHQGQHYPMKQHGIARIMDFKLIQSSESSCTFRLSSNKETYLQYPFDFHFDVHYEIQNDTLNVTYTIHNTGNQNLPANVGGHTAFIWPKNSKSWLDFEKEETHDLPLLNAGLLTKDTVESPVKNKQLQLSRDLFDRDALIFDQVQSRLVSYHVENKGIIHFHFNDFPFFAVWSPTQNNDAEFICLEPWTGHASLEGFDGEITDKHNIDTIPAHTSKSWSYQIQIIEK